MIYAANRIPEIADNIVEVDNAMKWGFAHELGVFETWDVIGVEQSVGRMRENRAIRPMSRRCSPPAPKLLQERERRAPLFRFRRRRIQASPPAGGRDDPQIA